MSARCRPPLRCPSRSTVTASACAETSSRRWLTNITACPSAAARRTAAHTTDDRSAGSAAVGSSRTSTRAPAASCSARAMASITRSAGWRARTGVLGSASIPNRSSSVLVRARSVGQSTARAQRVGKPVPIARFSATVRSTKTPGSWWTKRSPAARAHAGSTRSPATVEPRDRDAAATIRPVEAGDHLHQGRLAGAVAADQRVHLAAGDRERHVDERARAREGLRQVGDRERVALGRESAAFSRECARALGRAGQATPQTSRNSAR